MQTAVAEESPLRGRLILVVGARRSGTNWIGRIIATHPQVAYIPSETFLFAHLEAFAQGFQHASMGSYQTGTFYAERATLLRGLRLLCDTVLLPWLTVSGRTYDRVLERTPDHVRSLRMVAEVYPDAHVVHIIRDGRDVARSLAAMAWARGGAVAGAEEWVESVSQSRPAMEHYHELRYEAVLADPRGEVARLFEALGLPADPALIVSALTEAEVPFNEDHAMPTIAAEKWRGGLSARDLQAVENVAGATLIEFGYTLNGPEVATEHVEASASPHARAFSLRHLPRAAPLIARVRRSLAKVRRRPSPALDVTYNEFHWAQHTADQFLGHVRSGRINEAGELLEARVRIQVWTNDEEWESRGAEAAGRLLEILATDPVIMGKHVRSDVHPSLPAFTLVLAVQTGSRLEWRTLVLNIRSRKIVRVSYYALG